MAVHQPLDVLGLKHNLKKPLVVVIRVVRGVLKYNLTPIEGSRGLVFVYFSQQVSTGLFVSEEP